jgi:hypothetical protein
VPSSGQAIAAMSANYMAFTADKVALLEIVDIASRFFHGSYEFVPDSQRRLYRFL